MLYSIIDLIIWSAIFITLISGVIITYFKAIAHQKSKVYYYYKPIKKDTYIALIILFVFIWAIGGLIILDNLLYT